VCIGVIAGRTTARESEDRVGRRMRWRARDAQEEKRRRMTMTSGGGGGAGGGGRISRILNAPDRRMATRSDSVGFRTRNAIDGPRRRDISRRRRRSRPVGTYTLPSSLVISRAYQAIPRDRRYRASSDLRQLRSGGLPAVRHVRDNPLPPRHPPRDTPETIPGIVTTVFSYIPIAVTYTHHDNIVIATATVPR